MFADACFLSICAFNTLLVVLFVWSLVRVAKDRATFNPRGSPFMVWHDCPGCGLKFVPEGPEATHCPSCRRA